jgi:hypothetical protein
VSELSHAIAALCYLYGELDGLTTQRAVLLDKISGVLANVRSYEALVTMLGGEPLRVRVRHEIEDVTDAAAS